VLPFVNISSDSEQEYFSDGLTEELLSRLSRVSTLRVASRTSSFAFKGSRVPLAEIAQTLNVRTVLKGSVRKSGSRLRINAQLINASDGYQLWSAEFERELDDIFTIQEEISRSIVAALQARLDPGANAALTAETTNVEAYNLFLQARFFWGKRTVAGLARAEALLERPVEIEPGFARAHAALADAHYIAHEYSSTPQPDLVNRIIQAAQRAIALDSTLAEPWAALGGRTNGAIAGLKLRRRTTGRLR
jgi:adenylate cyclase